MKDGFFKFTVSEVLQETESTMTAIFEKGDQAAIVKKYRCERGNSHKNTSGNESGHPK